MILRRAAHIVHLIIVIIVQKKCTEIKSVRAFAIFMCLNFIQLNKKYGKVSQWIPNNE